MQDSKVKKSELVKAMAKKCNLSQKDCQAALNAFMASVEEFLYEGRTVSLSRFGDFVHKMKPEREARNPATGETFIAPPTKLVRFKVSQILQESINRDLENRRSKDFKKRWGKK